MGTSVRYVYSGLSWKTPGAGTHLNLTTTYRRFSSKMLGKATPYTLISGLR